MNRFSLLSLILAVTLGATACSEDITGPAAESGSELSAAPTVDTILRPGDLTIAAIADAEGFSLLLDAVNYIAATNPESELVAGLLDKSQYTVFAPTDTAFGNLVAAVEGLLDPDVLANEGPFAAIDDLLGAGTIEAVVSYHVTEGRRSSRSVLPRNGEREIETLLEGATFTVSRTGLIDAVGSDANIGPADISARNGIIHVIDAVLLPIDLGL